MEDGGLCFLSLPGSRHVGDRMKTSQECRKATPDVWLLGPAPPPVTGMTLLHRAVVKRAQAAGPAEFCNWSPRDIPRGFRFRLERARRIIGSLVSLMWHGRPSDGRLYISANSEGGLLLTAIAVAIGCSLGYAVYLHHHVYYYIDKHNWRMALITRLVGANGVHVVHCEQMERDFRATYATRGSFIYLNPSIVSLPVRDPRSCLTHRFASDILATCRRRRASI